MRADEQADEITWRLLDLFRRMQEGFEKAAADVGLSAAEAGALRRLEHPVSMRSVADALHCDASYVTVLTDRLESLGLVERVPDEKDRRVKHLVLTEKGKRTRDDLTKRVHATSPALAPLDAAGRDELLEVLRRLGRSSIPAARPPAPSRRPSRTPTWPGVLVQQRAPPGAHNRVMDDVIVVAGLRKDYGDVRAVDDLTFTVRRGEVFALLGPNGAGKTTTVEILEGHRDRTSGAVSVEGFDPATGGRAYREHIGVVLQEAGFDEEFTVRELVRMYASLYPRRRDPDELIALVGLADKADARTKTLSGGQRRRLDLALGLVGDPRLLFLDEPTTGFDPSARRRAWELIASLRSLGTTILLTTHYMEEAEALADRVGVMVAGRLVAVDTPADLVAREQLAVVSFTLPPGTAADGLPTLAGSVSAVDGAVSVETRQPTADLQVLTTWAMQQGVELPDLALSRPTLEDVYLRLTGDSGDRA